MSWWIVRKDKAGKRYLYLVGGGDMMPLMAVIGLLSALFAPTIIQQSPESTLVAIALWLLVIGFFCLTVAKVSLFRQSIWISWGPRRMTRRYARLYRVAYMFFAIGLLLLFAVTPH